MNLHDWHSQILSALAFLQRPLAGLTPPPGAGGRERLGILSDIRRLLAPDDHVPEVWKATLQRWAANLADCHRSYALESLFALALAVDNGIATTLAQSNEDFVRTADFPNVRFFGGPIPWACGLLSGLPAGHFLQTLVPDPYVFEGQRSLVLGFALPRPPWRARPFYPVAQVQRLTGERRRTQADAEVEAERRQQDEAERGRQAWENSAEGLRERLRRLERVT